MTKQKDVFFTIPDAPNYEINGYFKIRNKKTGRMLKGSKYKSGACLVSVKRDGKSVKRKPSTFYRQAKEYFLGDDDWAPVTSLQKKYELNWGGQLRNAKTKRLLKSQPHGGTVGYRLYLNKKREWHSQKALLNEVFDRKLKRKCQPVPCIVSKGAVAKYFGSMASAAKFLSKQVYCCTTNIRKQLGKRQEEIFAWKITYLGA